MNHDKKPKKSGDVSLTNDETREIENLFLERGRGRGSRKSAEKKKRRQMTKKAKHVLKMVNNQHYFLMTSS